MALYLKSSHPPFPTCRLPHPLPSPCPALLFLPYPPPLPHIPYSLPHQAWELLDPPSGWDTAGPVLAAGYYQVTPTVVAVAAVIDDALADACASSEWGHPHALLGLGLLVGWCVFGWLGCMLVESVCGCVWWHAWWWFCMYAKLGGGAVWLAGWF